MRREKRIYLFFVAAFFLLFILLIYRLYYIQIDKHEKLAPYAEKNVETVTVQGRRGAIYDRNGNPLAKSERKIDLVVDPKGVGDKEGIASILSEALGINFGDIVKILNKNSNFAYVKRDVSFTEIKTLKEKISEKQAELREEILQEKRRKRSSKINDYIAERQSKLNDFRNIVYQEGYKRVYPQGKLLANVLGFVQKNRNVGDSGPEGIEGLEREYDAFLSGKKREIKKIRYSGERNVSNLIEVDEELENYNGADVYLTIDSEIEFIAEEELAKMVEKTKAKWGGVVIIEPFTGKILAMANYPTYEPEKYFKSKAVERRNFTVGNLFEPGSTFKVFSILSVLNENLVKPGELIFGENGSFIFGRKRVRDSHSNQWMTIRDVVVTSSNIGTIKLADRLTNKQLYDYFTLFGFGQKSEINLFGESSLALRNYKKWYPIDKGNISFGQGLSVNMIQMVKAYSAIYNGGVLWRPVIVDRISGKDIEKIFVPKPTRISYNYNADKKLVEMLEGVVAEGTGKGAKLKGIKVGGKTGTSQIYDLTSKKYSWDRVVCSFIGAVPNDNPAFIMMVVIEEPEGREFGGTTAAPVFREISKRILPKFNIFVDKENDEKATVPEYVKNNDITGQSIESENEEENREFHFQEQVETPNFINKDAVTALELIKKKRLDVVFAGDPTKIIIEQSPAAGEIVFSGTVVTLTTEKGEDETY